MININIAKLIQVSILGLCLDGSYKSSIKNSMNYFS